MFCWIQGKYSSTLSMKVFSMSWMNILSTWYEPFKMLYSCSLSWLNILSTLCKPLESRHERTRLQSLSPRPLQIPRQGFWESCSWFGGRTCKYGSPWEKASSRVSVAGVSRALPSTQLGCTYGHSAHLTVSLGALLLGHHLHWSLPTSIGIQWVLQNPAWP